jgi:hypothetical protein
MKGVQISPPHSFLFFIKLSIAFHAQTIYSVMEARYFLNFYEHFIALLIHRKKYKSDHSLKNKRQNLLVPRSSFWSQIFLSRLSQLLVAPVVPHSGSTITSQCTRIMDWKGSWKLKKTNISWDAMYLTVKSTQYMPPNSWSNIFLLHKAKERILKFWKSWEITEIRGGQPEPAIDAAKLSL